jgi:hypothetical protein
VLAKRWVEDVADVVHELPLKVKLVADMPFLTPWCFRIINMTFSTPVNVI